MDRYTKGFIVASLLYFVAAAVLGIWMGSGDAPSWALFAHVHFNLLGFMTMMVYGVGYFVIPRFNARELRWPSWVPLHFWVANIGLVGLVASYAQMPSTLFTVFGVLSVLSVVLFAANLIGTILLPAQGAGDTAAPTRPAAQNHPAAQPGTAKLAQMKVGEIISRWPEAVQVLIENGLSALADEAHREQVRQLPVTLEMACSRHQLDLTTIVKTLQEVIARGGQPPLIGPDDVLGDILAKYPGADPVLRKYYGSGCFTCPGQATETVTQSAMMHNVDREALLRELNEVATAAQRGTGAHSKQ